MSFNFPMKSSGRKSGSGRMRKHYSGASQRELQAANSELARQAYKDALTGIANRRVFDERLATEWLPLHAE